METLAYLHLAQVYETPNHISLKLERKFKTFQVFKFFEELNWKKFSIQVSFQFLGISLGLAFLNVAHAEMTESYVDLGSSGDAVSQIQKELQKRGYFYGNVTGYYGPVTKAAVTKFQRDHGLQADGIVGPTTHGALTLAANAIPPFPPEDFKLLTSPLNLKQDNLDSTYNVKTPPNFQKSQKLQAIVDDILALATAQKLPTEPLSITLIDVKTGEIAGHQQNQARFPASVIKLFWMVELYAQIEQGILAETDFQKLIDKMINQSDNDAASIIVDAISNTKSGDNLAGKEYKDWLKRRQKINSFFQTAGYKDININQKVFPIDYLQITEPQGRELQMRGNQAKPIYNLITTEQAARLLYEIFMNQSVSTAASSKMLNWLTIDSATIVAQKGDKDSDYFNPVRGFLSESLPDNVSFAGKAGWNSLSRDEVALIRSKDGKVIYILAIFAANRAYANNWKIFPKMSQLVFERMVALSEN